MQCSKPYRLGLIKQKLWDYNFWVVIIPQMNNFNNCKCIFKICWQSNNKKTETFLIWNVEYVFLLFC